MPEITACPPLKLRWRDLGGTEIISKNLKQIIKNIGLFNYKLIEP